MFYRLYSKTPINKTERKNFIVSLFGRYGKMGTINKFNNGIGFKKVNYDVVNRIFSTEIPCPDDYCSPAQFISLSVNIDMSDNGIVIFDIENKDVKHPNVIYSYNTIDVFNKFISFIKKVYPSLDIEIVDSFNDTYVNRILTHMYLCVIEGKYINSEMSGERLLDNNEIQQISDELNAIAESPIKINQFFCQTCKSYNEHFPYHIEVEWLEDVINA